MSEITVLMATYNRAKDLLRVLQAYEQQTTPAPFELLVVDDASQDDTQAVLHAYQPQRYSLRVERMEKNSGQGQARNRAIPLAASPLILFTGDDMLPEPTFLEAHLAAHRRYPEEKVAILGRVTWPHDLPVNALMAHIDGVGAEQFSYYYLRDEHEYDFRHLYTSNVSLHRSLLLQEKHWFDPDFVMYGYEDAELGYRLARRGLRILYSSLPLLYHYHYHTVHTFAKRQYKAGRMACVFVHKHPETANLILGRRFARMQVALLQAASRFLPPPDGSAARLEKDVLTLASAYEWNPNPLTDQLFQLVLMYFFNKGIIDGMMISSKNLARARDYYARRALTRITSWFTHRAAESGIPVPL